MQWNGFSSIELYAGGALIVAGLVCLVVGDALFSSLRIAPRRKGGKR